VAPTLSTKALNRALLARQMLLERADAPVPDALERLIGLQAQVGNSPYLALWSRLEGFRPAELAELVERRRVVRMALMRSTIHSVTARDCLLLRPLTAAVQNRALSGNFGRGLRGVDRIALVLTARELLEAEPMTFAQLARELAARFPGRDGYTLAMAARSWIPLVQVPPRGLWGRGGPAAHTTVEAWLGRSVEPDPSTEALVLRYLAGYGPASVADMKVWAGLNRLGDVFERLRPRLETFRDENGVELFDLPDAPRPDAATPAPPRFLPEYDNALIGFADRSRVVPPGNREGLMTSGGLLTGTVLVDGFVRARWAAEVKRSTATLRVEAFKRLSKRNAAAVGREAARLLAFVAPDAADRDVVVGAATP
jgi:Winged helix DNA-binding domain